MNNAVDFDALARQAAQSNGAMDDFNALYGAAFALEQWHFIARGQFPNINPYVAANQSYADGQHMVRAFTDTDRLLRFAQENNLTNEDGSVSDLAMPTATIVDYLEQFIPLGVFGLWFNSDTQSEGFFLPLQQLRPVQEHLKNLKQSRLADFGLSLAPDGAVNLNLSITQQGAIHYDTPIASFYQTIAPLLENYQGVGAYTDLLALDAGAMSELVEDIARNPHGACLRLRRFLYRGADAMEFNTIDSNQLRHIQTNSSLLVNVALLKNLDRPTAQLYYRFEGPKSEVFNLIAHITPLLETYGFKADA